MKYLYTLFAVMELISSGHFFTKQSPLEGVGYLLLGLGFLVLALK